MPAVCASSTTMAPSGSRCADDRGHLAGVEVAGGDVGPRRRPGAAPSAGGAEQVGQGLQGADGVGRPRRRGCGPRSPRGPGRWPCPGRRRRTPAPGCRPGSGAAPRPAASRRTRPGRPRRSTVGQAGAPLEAGGEGLAQELGPAGLRPPGWRRPGRAPGRPSRRRARRTARRTAGRRRRPRSRCRSTAARVGRGRRGSAGPRASDHDTSAGRISVAIWPGGCRGRRPRPRRRRGPRSSGVESTSAPSPTSCPADGLDVGVQRGVEALVVAWRGPRRC